MLETQVFQNTLNSSVTRSITPISLELRLERYYRAGQAMELLAQMVEYAHSLNGEKTCEIGNDMIAFYRMLISYFENSRRGRNFLQQFPMEKQLKILSTLYGAFETIRKSAHVGNENDSQ